MYRPCSTACARRGWWRNEGGRARRRSGIREQFVWVIRGSIRLRIGAETRTIEPGDLAVKSVGSSTKRSSQRTQR